MAQKKSRRAHNSGAVYYSEAHQRWEAVVDLGYVTDPKNPGRRKRKRITRTGKTQAEVIEKLDRLKFDVRTGDWEKAPSPTLADFLRDWLASGDESRWRPKTREAYTSAVGRIIPALGHLRLDQLHNQHVNAFVQGMAATHSRNTIANTRGVLRAALNDAIRADLITRNAAAEARMPRHVEKETRDPLPLDRDEMIAFLEAITDNPYRDLFTVALMVGLRIGEARGLRWRDIDFPRNQLRVVHQLQRIGGRDQLRKPKSKMGQRTIPLPAEAVTALKRRRKAQLGDRVLAGGRWHDLDYVFTNTVGSPVDDSRVRKELTKACGAAGIERRVFHDLRHTCGTFLASTGVQPKELQRILGHESFETTMQLYVQSYTTSVEAAMRQWETLREAS